MRRFVYKRQALTLGLAILLALALATRAEALITGGEGNDPVTDPGWPTGAAVMFNHASRIAWWEGPPFGGGNWHGEHRGDAKVFNEILENFAKLDSKNKRVVVHDGVGQSFWLNMNREAAKKEGAKMDWSFSVWQPASWERLRTLPADLNPTKEADAEKGPPAQIDVYAGGNIKWVDVKIPKDITVVDNRLEAHGFKLSDGVVMQGLATDMDTKSPLAAKVRLELIEPQKKGGYEYKLVTEAATDKNGKWVLTKVPAGWHRIVLVAEGYVPRILGHSKQEGDQPSWISYEGGLAKAVEVSGVVTDDDGKPLADVDVRLDNVVGKTAGRYESSGEYRTKTDAKGQFRVAQVPAGKASVWVQKEGFCRPGLGLPIETPVTDVKLKMSKSATLQVVVSFGAKIRPEAYIIEINPEGEAAVGTWGGSANIDAANQHTFKNVPPGRYVLNGHPNPHSAKEKTDPMTVDLKGGENKLITIIAK